MNQSIVLTKEGHQALQGEYRRLVEQELPATISAVNAARSLGDLRENEAYHAARHKQALIQGRVEELKDILHDVQVADVPNGKPNTVTIGTWVKLEMDQETRKIQIVDETEADIKNAKVSSQSPLGQKLIGKRINDVVELDAPAGAKKYRLVEIT